MTLCILDTIATFPPEHLLATFLDAETISKLHNADKQTLQEVVKMAEEKCPAMYSMSHVIKVNAQIR
jgi:uncharacterized OsmC-like protein